jgi:hypothetical protein
MAQVIDLSIHQEQTYTGIRRTLKVDSDKFNITLYFDLVGCFDALEPEVLDGFVFGIIFLAMETGYPLRVHGKLSLSALYNLAEFQRAWACWLPERYSTVEIIPDSIEDLTTKPKPNCAISAFSGGVDSTFTAIRHGRQQLGNASYPLKDVILVHGFDVPLNREESFAKLFQRLNPLIEELGLGFKIIRTNLKEASGQDWEHSHGAQLAACLHNFAHEYRYAIIASTYPYNLLHYPWGSTPITDHLLSGDQMRIIHDGASYSRTEKLAEIAKHPTALKTLKVCWEGPNPEENCGLCEKCLRTKLNFLALGIDNPSCFDNSFNLQDITKISIRNQGQFNDLKSILICLERHPRLNEHPSKVKSALGDLLSAYRARQIVSDIEQISRMVQDTKTLAPSFVSKKNTLFKILANIDTPWLVRESFKEYLKKYLKNIFS